jgi:hypothetical protein
MVSVSAWIFPGDSEEGPALLGRDCRGYIKVGSKIFPNGIYLISPDVARAIPKVTDRPIDFDWDPTSRAEFRAKARSLLLAGSNKQLYGTVEGRFETRTPLLELIGLPGGFGEDNQYPARIVVKTIRSIRVEGDEAPAKKSDKSNGNNAEKKNDGNHGSP